MSITAIAFLPTRKKRNNLQKKTDNCEINVLEGAKKRVLELKENVKNRAFAKQKR